MSAFTPGNPLLAVRDSLRNEIKKLQASISVVSSWVEALERDRIPLPSATMTDLEYDSSLLSTAQSLLTHLQKQTSLVGLDIDVKSTLSIKAYDPVTKGPL